MVDGKIKLCKTGCIACPSNKCSGCSPGYVFDENAYTCYSCGVGCLNCDPTHPNICSSCRIGTYLSGTDCIPCDSTCVACSGSSTSCTTCPPGQYYNSDPSVLQCSLLGQALLAYLAHFHALNVLILILPFVQGAPKLNN